MNSCIYTGILEHTRHAPVRHSFRYRTAYFYLDLDELPVLQQRFWLFDVHRPAVFSFREADHLDGHGPLKERLLAFLDCLGVDVTPVARVTLLTHVRQWGYVFNPVSFFYCFTANGRLLCIVAEVNNTFGERYHYVLQHAPGSPSDAPWHFHAEKAMHVSPFTHRSSANYEFRFRPPDQVLTIAIRELERGRPVIDAAVWAYRKPLCDRQLLALALRHPWLTAKVTTAIHWQAFRLYWKRVPFFHQPPPSSAQSAQHAVWVRLAHNRKDYTLSGPKDRP